jgi:hypothetical protein
MRPELLPGDDKTVRQMSDSLNVEDKWNRDPFVRKIDSRTMPTRLVAIDGIGMPRILDGTYVKSTVVYYIFLVWRWRIW